MTRFAKPIDRIAQATYVVFALASAVALMFAAVNLVMLRLEDLAGCAVLTVIFYGLGWGSRWLINGTSTSLLDYVINTQNLGDQIYQTNTESVETRVPPRNSKEYLDWANREGKWADTKDP